jgi:hypothetical protein
MLLDPENFVEWDVEVRASDLEAAKKRCQVIANSHVLTELLNVTQATTTPYNGTYRFICWFRSEGKLNNDDSDTDN